MRSCGTATGLVMAIVLWGCGTAAPAGSCPNDWPTSCPSPAPSYDAVVSQIFHTRCVTCHFTGSTITARAFDTYANVSLDQQPIFYQVSQCLMPYPDGGNPLTTAERQALLGWIVCGAPNN